MSSSPLVRCSIISCRLSTDEKKSPPLGPLYIATAAEAAGSNIEFLDFQTFDGVHLFDVSGLVEVMLRAKSTLIAVSLFADALPLVLGAISVFEDSYGGKEFILGGPGVNENEKGILARYPTVCAIVRGEGEVAFPLVLEAIGQGKALAIPGVVMRSSGITAVQKPERLQTLDSIQHPNLSLLDLSKYDRFDVVSSRGCPFDCSFCEIITMWGRKVTYRSASDFVKEIQEIISATGIRNFSFIDDTFTINRKRVSEICRSLTSSEVDINWGCFSRIDTIDRSLAKEMSDSGCTRVFFGIDTGSELIWRNINKNFSKAQVIDVISGFLNHLNAIASYIWGYPDEDYRDFCDTIDLAYRVSRIAPSDARYRVTTQLHFLSPTRATPIFAAHSDKLRFSEGVPLEITGGRALDALKDSEGGYELCLSLIKSDPAMFASYHYYESPKLDQKLDCFVQARRICERILGAVALATDRRAQWDASILDLVGEIELNPTPEKQIGYLRVIEMFASHQQEIESLPQPVLEGV